MSADENHFGNLEKRRDVQLILPENKIKAKIGEGGIAPGLLDRAQDSITANRTDFLPIAEEYFDILDTVTRRIADKALDGAEAFEALFFPLVQLKAQGGMFKYPLITEISGMLINFLEVIKTLDDDALRIVNAHKMTLRAILSEKVPGEYATEQGKALAVALQDVCLRYFQSHKEI